MPRLAARYYMQTTMLHNSNPMKYIRHRASSLHAHNHMWELEGGKAFPSRSIVDDYPEGGAQKKRLMTEAHKGLISVVL